MSKKVRANRKFESLFELADYLNYYFQKNPDASVSMNDIKKIVDNNPNFSVEEPTIGNSALRPVISDNEGHTLMLEMRPSFVVYNDVCEDGPEEPEYGPDEDVKPEEEAEPEEESEEEEHPEEEVKPEEEPEVEEESAEEEPESDEEAKPEAETDEEGRKIDRAIMEKFDWVKPGVEFYWINPTTNDKHVVVCDGIQSTTGQVQSEYTDITVHMADDPNETLNVFCDEITPLDEGEEAEDDPVPAVYEEEEEEE